MESAGRSAGVNDQRMSTATSSAHQFHATPTAYTMQQTRDLQYQQQQQQQPRGASLAMKHGKDAKVVWRFGRR